jgi:hypothetical protein
MLPSSCLVLVVIISALSCSSITYSFPRLRSLAPPTPARPAAAISRTPLVPPPPHQSTQRRHVAR